MTFKVLTPKLDSTKNCYIFQFKDAERFTEMTQDPTRLTVTEEILRDFVSEFLGQASQYFSKPLDSALFFQRLAHVWNTSEVDLDTTTSDTVRASWIPAQILFYAGRYEIHWNLVEVETLKIPPGFMEEIPPGPTDSGDASIPFEDPASNTEKAKRARERRRIREARLRVVLSKLRAERLAERYYKRYGNFDGAASESELSSEEELLPPEAAATPK
jgi:hypothetical protein